MSVYTVSSHAAWSTTHFWVVTAVQLCSCEGEDGAVEDPDEPAEPELEFELEPEPALELVFEPDDEPPVEGVVAAADPEDEPPDAAPEDALVAGLATGSSATASSPMARDELETVSSETSAPQVVDKRADTTSSAIAANAHAIVPFRI